MPLTLIEEKELRIDSARLGAEMVLRKLGIVRDEISQREAYLLFGEAKVRSWVNQSLVQRIKTGASTSNVTYSLIELETIQQLEANRKLK